MIIFGMYEFIITSTEEDCVVYLKSIR